MAQANVMVFPKEFERSFWRDADKGFSIIFLVTFLICNSVFYVLCQRPPRAMTAEELKAYTEVIYRVKLREEKVVVKETKVATGAEKVEEAPKEEAPVEEAKPTKEVSAEEKAAVREAKKDARKAKQESQKQAIAERIKMLAGPTAKGGGRRAAGGRGAAAAALGLSGGGLGGVDVSKSIGIVSDAGTAAKVQKLRGGGGIAEGDLDLGDLDIGEALSALSADDQSLMLKEAPVELNQSTITAQGKGAKSARRSQKAISDVVVRNQNQVTYCYWMLKRRDSSLKGKVQMRFEIEANGSVARVKFKSQWAGNNPLGEEVERCITNVVTSWHFEPIDEAEGSVTAGASYIFE